MFSFGDDENGIIWNERKNKGEREGGTLTSGKKKKKDLVGKIMSVRRCTSKDERCVRKSLKYTRKIKTDIV